MHIDKSYFTLPEILERWQITEADLIYLAENEKLRLSVRVFGVPMEFGDYEEGADGEPCRVPWEQNYYSGLLDLHARDVFQLFRCVEVHLARFRTQRADYAETWGDAQPVLAAFQGRFRKREPLLRFPGHVVGAGQVADQRQPRRALHGGRRTRSRVSDERCADRCGEQPALRPRVKSAFAHACSQHGRRLGNPSASRTGGPGPRRGSGSGSGRARPAPQATPAADASGYVQMPNVDPVQEMVNMISASRSYQANVETLNTAKTLMLKTLTIGT